jgi:hypothetical protein
MTGSDRALNRRAAALLGRGRKKTMKIVFLARFQKGSLDHNTGVTKLSSVMGPQCVFCEDNSVLTNFKLRNVNGGHKLSRVVK